MSGRVAGKVALVTGAARGQGRSHAVRLAEEGADIIAVDICDDVETVPYGGSRPADLAETARLVEKLDRRIVTDMVDVREQDELNTAVRAGVDELGRLDIVSANAGILSLGLIEELSDLAWQTMLDVNLTGVWHAAKAAIPVLKEQGTGGSIILTSSLSGLRAYPSTGHYTAAKHGVVGLMRAMAYELAPFNVRVNSVHPTNVLTSMIDNEATYRIMRPDLPSPTLEDAAAVYSSMNLLPVPWVEVRDISNAVLWLASDEARYITGVALPVDAGAAIK